MRFPNQQAAISREHTMNLREIWDKHEDEFLKFERVQNKLSNRPDIHAFLLLDKLVPGDRDIVGSAEHDEIWLDVDPAGLEAVEAEEQIVELIRCGVRLDSQFDALAMFV